MRFSSRKKFKVALASLFSASLLAVAIPAMAVEAAKPVNIPDQDLKKVLCDELGLNSDQGQCKQLTDKDLEKLDGNLYLWDDDFPNGNVDLTGLEYAKNLGRLDVHVPIKKGLSSIGKLNQLETLNIEKGEGISSLKPLAGMTGLDAFWISGGSFTTLSGIENLTNLKHFGASNLRLIDISAIKSLKKLTDLHLGHNKIENVEPLAGFDDGLDCNLSNNNIKNISALRGENKPRCNVNNNHITDFTGFSSWGLRDGQTLHYIRKGGTKEDRFTVPFVKDVNGNPMAIEIVSDNPDVYVSAENGKNGIDVVLTPRNGSVNPLNKELKIVTANEGSSTIATIFVTLKDNVENPKPGDSAVTPKPGADTPAPKPGVDPKPGAGNQPGANPGGDTAVKPGTDNEIDKDKDTSKDGADTGKGASKGKDKGSEGADSKDKDVKGQDNSDKANQPENPANTALATTGSMSLILLVLATALIGVGTVTVATRRSAK